MLQIVFPGYEFTTRNAGGQSQVFDTIRKRYVALTPEEWVRQHWLKYLVEEMKYPKSLIAVEMSLKLNKLSKRCDIVVYGRNGTPQLIVECKSGAVKLTQKVFDQIARYNLALKVKYLVVSNGQKSFCCEIDVAKKNYHFMEELPKASDFL
ncbi:MAG TPA: type I restriction enzyme HsdR N-terminal domain-containing protein [Chitinophagales bacterium]|nr:type I restriction enzyme HsdR N-terminal domain-containing protein [Chitinophagales bacterium]